MGIGWPETSQSILQRGPFIGRNEIIRITPILCLSSMISPHRPSVEILLQPNRFRDGLRSTSPSACSEGVITRGFQPLVPGSNPGGRTTFLCNGKSQIRTEALKHLLPFEGPCQKVSKGGEISELHLARTCQSLKMSTK